MLERIRRLHAQIRTAVVAACERESLETLAEIDHESEGDTIYAIDRFGEDLLIDFFEREIAVYTPILLIAEGLPGNGQVMLPRGLPEEAAVWRIIVDPIDGTRGLMYQKRSGWILTAVAPNRGAETNLQDIVLAVQTEIPLIKQHLSDSLWAVRGQGAQAERFNRLTGESSPLTLHPSRAKTIAHGFAMLARFSPGGREILAAIDDEIAHGALGAVEAGKASCFEDQYISSGGQLYELMAGHDRFVADLRPWLVPLLAQQGLQLGACCRPYDLCTELIARELGVIVTDEHGQPVQSPLNVTGMVTWVGYANADIRAQIEPLLQAALQRRENL
jgi:fructose-1,6-bisphosphatase/inositol monophosphatase family enzyme